MSTIKLGTFTYDQFVTDDFVKTITTAYSVPKNSIVVQMAIAVKESFIVDGSSYVAFNSGGDINPYEYVAGIDLIAQIPRSATASTYNSYTISTPITITVQSDANLLGLTAGSMDVYITILALDQFTIETTGNTTFPVTKDCWLNGIAIVGTTSDSFSIGLTSMGSELGTGTIDATGILSFGNPMYFSETTDTTVYISTASANSYKIKLNIE